MGRKTDYVALRRNTEFIKQYATENDIKMTTHNNGFHIQLKSPVVFMDVWPSTGKYHVIETSYHKYYKGVMDRSGKVGFLPSDATKLTRVLDGIFFAGDAV